MLGVWGTAPVERLAAGAALAILYRYIGKIDHSRYNDGLVGESVCEYPKLVGEYPKLVGEYPGLVGECPKLVGEYPGLVGEYPQLVGEYPGLVSE